MDKELKAEFDYIILGSNFENSVLAGALSRIGKRVLLIERNAYYGSNNATFSFKELLAFGRQNCTREYSFETTPSPIEKVLEDLNEPITKRKLVFNEDEIEVKEEEPIIPIPSTKDSLRLINTEQLWNNPSILFWKESEDQSFVPQLEKNTRKYNIDLASAMILAGGEIVDVLANSGLGQYCQFYPMHTISALIEKDDSPQLLQLPCSRQEIFNNKNITLKDKRLLTKFIQYIIDRSVQDVDQAKEMNDVELKQGRSLTRPQNKSVMVIDLTQYKNTSFVDFLEKEFSITGILKDMIIYSICLTGSDQTILTDSNETPYIELNTEEGIKRVEAFITSLNIYGTTPFLYPIYGEGDILQSFCRINNVYGGITMLQTEVVRLVVKDEKIAGVEICNDVAHRVIRCKNVIASDDYFLNHTMSESEDCKMAGKVVHGIYIVNGDNKNNVKNEKVNDIYGAAKTVQKELRDIVVLPATKEHRAIYLLILNAEFKLTAPGELLIHAFMEGDAADEAGINLNYQIMDNAVKMYLQQLQSSVPVTILYNCHFVECSYHHDEQYANYYYLPSRNESCYLFMDHRMQRVREFFSRICPDCEFLPRTHSSREASKDDVMNQELSYFDQLVEKLEKDEPAESVFFVC